MGARQPAEFNVYNAERRGSGGLARGQAARRGEDPLLRKADMNKRIGRVALAAMALATMGCLVPAAQAQSEPLRWKLQPGQQFQVVVSQKMDQQMQGIDIPITSRIEMNWRVLSADGNNVVLAQAITRFALSMRSPQGAIEFDSANPEGAKGEVAEQLKPAVEGLVGKEIRYAMSPLGVISNVEIPPDLSGPGAGPLSQMFNADSLKQMIQQQSFVLPEAAPTEGQSWDQTNEIDTMGMKMIITNTYTYGGTEIVEGRRVHKFSSVGQTELVVDKNAPMKTTIESQESSGTMHFDNEAGYFIGGSTTQKMGLRIEFAGQSIPQSTSIETTIKVSPVD
jgi:hypothetical protein